MAQLEKIKEVVEDQKKAEAMKSLLVLKPILENGIKPPEWNVKDLLPQNGITLFGSDPGKYKTFLAQDMALCLSKGLPFLDRFETKKTSILYIDEENGEFTLPYRFNLLKKGYDYFNDFDNVFLSIFKNVKLDTFEGRELLKEKIKACDAKVIILDSMVRMMEGDENSASDVRKIFENIKLIREEIPDLSFLILHHTNKGGNGNSKSLRGSGDFVAFADVVLMFDTSHNGFVNVSIKKNRHIDMRNLPDFSVKVNGCEDQISFEYVEGLAATDAVGRCLQDYESWINEANVRVWNWGDMVIKMKSKGHSRDASNKLRKLLMDSNRISKLSQGKYEVNEPLVKEEDIQ